MTLETWHMDDHHHGLQRLPAMGLKSYLGSLAQHQGLLKRNTGIIQIKINLKLASSLKQHG
ncbi:hypothetical protein I79_020164 [Cricetulus griseus]|uniref:Uncharacterized protein n=1 Tax=Cricetulus griseus TaxID=10029 RepID=G3I9C7_CRIGR|nr:hypothetical protein I79_020164 [Cricetulus griseus]